MNAIIIITAIIIIIIIIVIFDSWFFWAVELGKRYFPNCSQVVDKFMDDDTQDLLALEKGPPDDQNMKKMRFMELKEDVRRAFTKDKAESSRSGISSSSSSSSSQRAERKSSRGVRS